MRHFTLYHTSIHCSTSVSNLQPSVRWMLKWQFSQLHFIWDFPPWLCQSSWCDDVMVEKIVTCLSVALWHWHSLQSPVEDSEAVALPGVPWLPNMLVTEQSGQPAVPVRLTVWAGGGGGFQWWGPVCGLDWTGLSWHHLSQTPSLSPSLSLTLPPPVRSTLRDRQQLWGRKSSSVVPDSYGGDRNRQWAASPVIIES